MSLIFVLIDKFIITLKFIALVIKKAINSDKGNIFNYNYKYYFKLNTFFAI